MITAARAMSDIFIVHSILAVSRIGAVTRELVKEETIYSKKEQSNNSSFSSVLQQEIDHVGKDALNCHTVTYGVDRKIHHYEYLRREYKY